MKLFGTHSSGLHLGMSTALIQAVRWIMSIKINRKVVSIRALNRQNLPEQCWLARYSQRKTHLQILIKQAVADLHAKV